MLFNNIIGNETLIRQLKKMADEGRVAHSIMLIEENGYGALPIALAFIQYIACKEHINGDSCGHCHTCNSIQKLIHPDIHFVFPVNVTAKSGSDKKPTSDSFLDIWRNLVLTDPYFSEDKLSTELGIENKVGTISVTEATSILSKMNLMSYEGGNKYMIIYLPERMTTEASNKLLKMVEEPFPGTYYFFITHSPEKVIKTISSRCLRVQLRPSGIKKESTESPYFPLAGEIFENCFSRNLTSLISLNEKICLFGREKEKDFCLYLESFLRNVLMVKKGLYDLTSINDSERETIISLSQKMPDSFFDKAYSYIENARISIESNVSDKMVFCNLLNLFFVSLCSCSQN